MHWCKMQPSEGTAMKFGSSYASRGTRAKNAALAFVAVMVIGVIWVFVL